MWLILNARWSGLKNWQVKSISGLQFEAEGKIMNLRRPYEEENAYCELDFLIDGPKPYTHFNMKNPVGSDIKKSVGLPPSIKKQGVSIGKKIVWQKKFWSGGEKQPTSPEEILHGVDNFDVPIIEKLLMKNAIVSGSKNVKEVIFINDGINK